MILAPLWLALLLAGTASALLVLSAGERARAHSFIARARLAAAQPASQQPRAGTQRWWLWLVPPGAIVLAIALTAWVYGDAPPWLSLLGWSLGTGGAVLFWHVSARKRRQQAIAMAFPDLVAHLSLQLQAGATARQAFSSSLAVVQGPLNQELALLVADLALAPLDAGLMRFAERAADPQIWSFCQHVVQQQHSGMSLAGIFAAEERHTMAMQQQQGRERISRAGAGLSAVLVILLLNGAIMWTLPMALAFLRYLDH